MHLRSPWALQCLLVGFSLCAATQGAAFLNEDPIEVAELLFHATAGTTLPNVAVDIQPSNLTDIPDAEDDELAALPTVAVDERPAVSNTTRLTPSKQPRKGTEVTDFTPEDLDRDDNYCKYYRSQFGFNRYWLVIAPEAKHKDIPDWCGGLWDNLKRWPSCSAVSRAYCGKRKGEDEGKPGLQWEFKITDTCHSGYMNSVWWEATKGKLGKMECVKDPRDKVT